jgi:hypothetical protein
MKTILTSMIICSVLLGAVFLGMRTRRRLPPHHLNEETKATVKAAVGLIATMSALLLGLMVNSAKDTYDTLRSEVIQISAKLAFLDRGLHLYGPEAEPMRAKLRTGVEELRRTIWSESGGVQALNLNAGEALFNTLQTLPAATEQQRLVKAQILNEAVEIGQLRTLLRSQGLASISIPLLVMVVVWLIFIFFSFSVFAPPNSTAATALTISALSVSAALFLVMELDRPFTGLIRISQVPLVNALIEDPKGAGK